MAAKTIRSDTLPPLAYSCQSAIDSVFFGDYLVSGIIISLHTQQNLRTNTNVLRLAEWQKTWTLYRNNASCCQL